MAVYACSDLHGNMELYNQIKLFLEPEDKVYFLGDANDRGKYGWELIKAIYNDPQFIYLRGNHEDMFVAAALDMLEKKSTDNITLLYQNGGAKTISGWSRDGRPRDWLDKIMALPVHAEYENEDGKIILMSHAGYTPKLVGDKIELPSEDYLLWDRDHIFDEWDFLNFEDYIVVHGHTPTCYLAVDLEYPGEEIPAGAFWYDDYHKVCLDNASYHSGFSCLLNLDTLEDVVFSLN